ncbi:flagellar assembly protein FliW [Caproiciproducens sp. MSJ-32]|uniref:flagellar assembly protein FliW n=1 Tax=Caproiciproducens sp. MSJ-32 TaxID=2841527 RepID=UPI001C126F3B|nr:flagellar assembly protein FliW [Caproiciproducens sp. MSJ-32]MBU5454616.1 flagellar assembly protein FliW [Caproiciproducens sp. MSJ-32]
MEIISPVHGKMIYEEKEIIYFEKGIPGFDELKKYIIKEVDEESPFKIMQSIENAELGFIIISPFEIKKDYQIKLSNEIIEALNIQNQKDVLLYSIVKLDSKVENITANLKAPLVININSKKGQQYILDKEDYNIREKVFNN